MPFEQCVNCLPYSGKPSPNNLSAVFPFHSQHLADYNRTGLSVARARVSYMSVGLNNNKNSVCVCHTAHMEVRGHFKGVLSLYSVQLRLSGMTASVFTC